MPPPDRQDEALPRPEAGASVLARLRDRIIRGEYPPGMRLTEDGVAEALAVSRTPVRLALRSLEQEGLLQKSGKRGLVVRAFSSADVLCAVEVRGALEGLAARRLAEAGLPAAVEAALAQAIRDGRAVLAKGHLVGTDIDAWSQLNRTFHGQLVGAAGSPVIAEAIARNNHLPFASADSITLDQTALDREFTKLSLAQAHHELVLDALRRREGARVEALMREHAWVGVRYAELLGR
ncbi:GntR family transcriptional regulator [Ideonella livida]|uniref:GntR family transcriptional regulator n=1 Tax=Ideonella livida TaxID=2707176 RepID=A0A7C9TK64_9BURK|nr:GntR family transcriptional regulator [Ideonella livida]NDY90126.1 GntR family transcriptional regulator [Ideonella livida]